MAGMVEINILMNKAKPTMSVEFNQFVGTISNTNMNMRPLIIETYIPPKSYVRRGQNTYDSFSMQLCY